MSTLTSDAPNWFAASRFGQFMASSLGRAVRIVAGIALVAVGLLSIGVAAGYVVASIGLVPLPAGGLGALRDPDNVVPDQIATRIQQALPTGARRRS